jgi:hypothetical protein
MDRQIRRVRRGGGDSVSRAGLARLSNDGGSHTAEEIACLGEDAGGGGREGAMPFLGGRRGKGWERPPPHSTLVRRQDKGDGERPRATTNTADLDGGARQATTCTAGLRTPR